MKFRLLIHIYLMVLQFLNILWHYLAHHI